MAVLRNETLPIQSSSDVVLVRQHARTLASELQFSLVDQTKMVTAASEIARNTLIYGGGGNARFEVLEEGPRKGLRIEFTDEGPGIPDIELAMRDGYTSSNGLGLGLGGARRLVNEFAIKSKTGEGTHVTITRWK